MKGLSGSCGCAEQEGRELIVVDVGIVGWEVSSSSDSSGLVRKDGNGRPVSSRME